MVKPIYNTFNSIATIFVAMLFFSCGDNYKRVGDEAKKNVFPVGIAENFVLTYTEANQVIIADSTESSRVISVLTSPMQEDFTNLEFPYRTFPNGLHMDFFDDSDQKSIVKADYGIIYSATNLIDLRGNVVLESHDGKKLETSQLYLDQVNEWIFTHETFTYTNPEDGTIMDGEGMDFSKDRNFLYAHKTYGLMLIPEEKEQAQEKEPVDD
ncbi:LPS export ABC transporter periplasmic protein LptC [Maribacter algarum]|uniref:LPS export ABC transporter periplasmic protein LptC n=1 Tax=Maribacter algarum (ex Zhang et al. 2020) TaxID=2578118 RepID=A0A5S3PYV9_9FLAO|nr:LPS export ABC transporter periplasmic protein LptC [Maribacter algarum]TMM59472.1 LPS export ABC transporter periplasmic protein LptC [Maribacter algarum]